MSNVEWDTDFEEPAAPWLTPRRGRDNVASFEGHYFVFNDQGKVIKFQHLADTALQWRVANAR
jgi:hypothetical protein